MALREDLLSKAGEILDDKGSEWFDEAVGRSRSLLPQLVDEVNRGLPEGVAVTEEQAGTVLDLLESGKAPVLRLGSLAFARVVASLESGEEEEAQNLYLKTQAIFAERNAAIDTAGDQAFDEAKERSDAWEAFKATIAAVAETVGEVGFNVVVGLARTAVGI